RRHPQKAVAGAGVRIVPAGDSALVVELEERIDAGVNAHTIALADAITAADLAGVRDVVPTYRSVAVYFDPLRVDYDALIARIEGADRSAVPQAAAAFVRIPVCYGGELGPDLGEVASFAGTTEDEVVRLHTARRYRVFMLGFV